MSERTLVDSFWSEHSGNMLRVYLSKDGTIWLDAVKDPGLHREQVLSSLPLASYRAKRLAKALHGTEVASQSD